MNSDSNVKKIVKSFRFAGEGILSAIKKERNMKIHLVISLVVIIMGLLYSLSILEWICMTFAIGGMLSLELLNTAIERVVDLVTDKYHPLAKQAKDIAAGAVLIYALVSVIIGLFIFIPKVFS